MKKNKFIEGTLFAYIAILITKVIGAFYVIPLCQIIGESGKVLYGYAYQIYSLFLDISTSGVPTAISIIVAEYNALKMFNEREYAFKVANRLISIVSIIAFIAMFSLAQPFANFLIADINKDTEEVTTQVEMLELPKEEAYLEIVSNAEVEDTTIVEEISMENKISNIVLVIRVISFCILIIPFLSITRGYLQGNRYTNASSSSQLIEQLVRIIVALVGSYIAINILCLDIPIGVSVALVGTVLGGLFAYLYLRFKIHKNKDQFLEGVTSPNDSTVGAKEIIKKIISRAIPVIIIASIQNIYNIVDLKLLMQGLHYVGFSAVECENIGTTVVVWTPKICMMINTIAVSMCLSIIPFIVNSYVNKEKKELNFKFNQAMSTIIYVAVPLAIFIAIYSKEVYGIFYDEVYYGGIILAINAITSVFFSLQMVMDMMLQGMKNYKLVYTNTVIGLLINILLDIPLIMLLKNLGISPYIGTIFATMIGLLVSILIILVGSKKKYELKYISTLKATSQIVLSSVIMGFIAFGLKTIMPELHGRIHAIIILGIFGTISMLVYLLMTFKIGTMNDVLGEDFLKNIFSKFKKKESEN